MFFTGDESADIQFELADWVSIQEDLACSEALFAMLSRLMRSALGLLLGLTLLSGCSVGLETIRVVGDESCASLPVYLDGVKVGSLDRLVLVRETNVADGLHEWWGGETRGDTLWRAGDRRYRKSIYATRGPHEIAVNCPDGRRLSAVIDVKVYNHVKVSCALSRIRVQSEDD